MKKDIYLSIEIQNLKQSLADTLNENPLPFCIKQLILKEFIPIVDEMAQKEYKNDTAERNKEEKNDGQAEGDSDVEADRDDDRQDGRADAG